MAAGVKDVVESGQRPMPGAFLKPFLEGSRPERDRRFPAQRGERPVAHVVVECPESQLPRSISASGTSGGGVSVRLGVSMPMSTVLVVERATSASRTLPVAYREGESRNC